MAPPEAKVALGSFTGILTGLISWALVAYIPAFRSGLPPAVAALIPVAVGWLAHSVAAYMAPHTSRFASGGVIARGGAGGASSFVVGGGGGGAGGSGSVTRTSPATDRPAGGITP